jgi:hypothetical protein
MNEIYKLRPVIGSVDGFFQEKWKIASDKPGSGNTKNIGSISAVMYDFQNPKPIFKNEEEFIKYWRQYPLTSKDNSFSDIQSYRKCLCR